MIEYNNLVKRYEQDDITAVTDFSLQVDPGELVVLLGPSGCGKTTLLRLTNRLENLNEGEILINGQAISDQDPVKLRQRIGYVIQEIGLFPNKTIGQNIGMIPKVLDWTPREIDQRVDYLLEMMNLDPQTYKSRYPAQLSGGQRQRVGVARALAADPEILLMDEPFGAIDPINRKVIQDEFLKLQQKLEKTIVFVTHDIEEAIKMADKIALVKQGRLVQYDTPENILLQPANEFVKDFVGTERAMKALNLVRVEEAMAPVDYHTADLKVSQALSWLNKYQQNYLLICSTEQEPLGYISRHDLEQTSKGDSIRPLINDLYTVLYKKDTLKEALTVMVSNEVTTLCVVNEQQKLVGTINFSDLQNYLLANYQSDKELGA